MTSYRYQSTHCLQEQLLCFCAAGSSCAFYLKNTMVKEHRTITAWKATMLGGLLCLFKGKPGAQ